MADIADIANDRAQVMLDASLASKRGGPAVISLKCDDCDVAIPEKRREALIGHGCVRCISCQTFHERRGGGA